MRRDKILQIKRLFQSPAYLRQCQLLKESVISAAELGDWLLIEIQKKPEPIRTPKTKQVSLDVQCSFCKDFATFEIDIDESGNVVNQGTPRYKLIGGFVYHRCREDQWNTCNIIAKKVD
jgi:hypothetical protein